jgi:hypothetical protein
MPPEMENATMVNETKLKRLRERYLGAHGGEMYDPHFSAVARQQFSGERRKWPFADVATLLGAPYRPEVANSTDFGGLDFALLGVPMDLGVTNRAGARFGPRAVRAVERVGPYEHVLRNSRISATWRCARASRSKVATRISKPSMVGSSKRAWFR